MEEKELDDLLGTNLAFKLLGVHHNVGWHFNRNFKLGEDCNKKRALALTVNISYLQET